MSSLALRELDESGAADSGKTAGLVLLGLALIIGLTRFVALGSWGIWYDEALTWGAYTGAVEYNHWTYPLWYWSVGVTIDLLGGVPDEFSLRLLPALMGYVSIPLTWWLFRPLAGHRVAGASALVLAVSSWHLYLSQTSRPYSTALAFTVLGAGIALRGALRDRHLWTVAGLLVAALGAGFHPSAAIGAGGIAAAAWALRNPQVMRWQGPTAVVLLLVAAVAMPAIAKAISLPLRDEPSTGHFLLALGFHAGPITLSAAIVGAVAALRRSGGRARVILHAALMMLVAGLMLSLRVRVTARYVLWAIPWLAALGCVPLMSKTRSDGTQVKVSSRLRWGYLALLILPQLPGLGLYFNAWNGSRPFWREAFQLVQSERAPEDAVLGVGELIGEYYLGNDDRLPQPGAEQAVYHLTDWADVVANLAPNARAWIVLRPEELEDWDEPYRSDLKEFLRERCRLQEIFLNLPTMGRNLSLEVYRSDPVGL